MHVLSDMFNLCTRYTMFYWKLQHYNMFNSITMNFDPWPTIPIWSSFRFTETGQTQKTLKKIKKKQKNNWCTEISECRKKEAKPQVSTDFLLSLTQIYSTDEQADTSALAVRWQTHIFPCNRLLVWRFRTCASERCIIHLFLMSPALTSPHWLLLWPNR